MPRTLARLLALFLAGARCHWAGAPAEHPAPPGEEDLQVTGETRRLEPLARDLALRLAEPRFRARFDARLDAEGVVRLPGPIGLPPAEVLAWVPLPLHRSEWRRARPVRVLVAAWAGGRPVAYGPEGDRHLLDPTRPPYTPVVLVAVPGPASTEHHRPVWLNGGPGCSTPSPSLHGGMPCDSDRSP